MRASVLSSFALGLVLVAATCLPASARMGAAFPHGIGAHFHGGDGHEHHHHYWRNTLGGGIDLGTDDSDAPPPAQIYVAPAQIVQNTTAPTPVSDGPRIIVLDHHKSHKPRGPLPVIIYGDTAS